MLNSYVNVSLHERNHAQTATKTNIITVMIFYEKERTRQPFALLVPSLFL